MRSQRPAPDARRLRPCQLSQLVIATLDGDAPQVIYETDQLIEAPNWTPDGRWLIYNAHGRLFRISPDGQDGPDRINTSPIENLNNDHVIAPDGQCLYLSANDGHLYRVSIDGGQPERVSTAKDPARHYRHYLHGISPDGLDLAYVALEQRADDSVMTRIALMPATGGPPHYLTDGASPVDGPEYSPDGNWIYFNAEAPTRAPGHAQLYRMRRDGSGLQQLTNDSRVNWFPHLSPDGQTLVYISFPPGTRGHPADRAVIIRAMQPNGGGLRDIDAFNGGQGSINVNSWAPESRRFAYIRYPIMAH